MRIDEETGKPIVELSHSGLATFNSCPKKFAFRKMIVNFNEDRGESDAASVGTALHEGIQEYMRSRDELRAIEKMVLHHPIQLKDSAKSHEYSVEASITTMRHVFYESELPKYELATFSKNGVEIPATEVAFLVVVELEHLVFHLRGFIDLVLQTQFGDGFFAVDIKTITAQSAGHMEAKYKWDWQATSYGIPLNALLGNHPSFRTGIFGVVQSDRSPSTMFPNYLRTNVDIDDYQHYLVDSCRRIQEYWKADRFPRGPGSCIAFSRVCPYHGVCGPHSLRDMQILVNPSMKEGAPGREFDPVFIARLEA